MQRIPQTVWAKLLPCDLEELVGVVPDAVLTQFSS